MAAIFYSPTATNSIFKGDFPVVDVIRVDFLESILGSKSGVVITSLEVINTETIQYFLTFDDAINYFYFGKGLGTINIRGMIFSDCNGNMPGIGAFYNAVGAVRGKTVRVSLGYAAFEGVVSNFSTATAPDPALLTEFSLTLTMTNHNLHSPKYVSVCKNNASGSNTTTNPNGGSNFTPIGRELPATIFRDFSNFV